MPKIVNKDARKLHIAETYLSIVAEEGAPAATSRRLAQELGVATGALWHYFENFDELLSRAFQLVFDQTNARIAEATAERTGLDALARMIEQIHPLDKTTHDEAAVVLSFWGRLATQPRFAVHQAFIEGQWRADYLLHLQEAIRDGEISPDAPIEDLADALIVLAIGYQVEHTLDTPIATPAAQWRVMTVVLSPWTTALGSARFRANRRASTL